MTDGAGTTVTIDVDDLPAGTTDIIASMGDASAQAVADALAEAGLPAGTMAFGGGDQYLGPKRDRRRRHDAGDGAV